MATAPRIICEQAFTGVGAYTWTPPEGVAAVDVLLVGGGGGGGGAALDGNSDVWFLSSGSGGGGGHVTVQTQYPVDGEVALTVGVGGARGRGGNGEPSTPGEDGAPSTFGALRAPGGGGGGLNRQEPGTPIYSPGGSSGLTINGASSTYAGGRSIYNQADVTIQGGGGQGSGGPSARAGGYSGAVGTSASTVDAVRQSPWAFGSGSGGNGARVAQGLFSVRSPGQLGGGGAGGAVPGGGDAGTGGYGGGGSSYKRRGFYVVNGEAGTGGGGAGGVVREYYQDTGEFTAYEAGNGGSGRVAVRWVGAPSITTAALNPAIASTQYSQTLLGTGESALSWSVIDGELPSGLTLSEAGTLSGIPELREGGNVDLTIELTDGFGRKVVKTFTMLLQVPLAVEEADLVEGNVGEPYASTTLLAKGGSGVLTWTAEGLPPGLVLSPSGELSGTPTESGAFTVTVTVKDESGETAEAVLSLGIGIPAPLIGTADVPLGTEGGAFRGTVNASGGTGPYSWQVTDGALPAGLSLSEDGEITGTPDAAGTFTVTATVTDAQGATADVDVEIVIEPMVIDGQDVPICHLTDDGYELVIATDAVFDGRGAHGDHSGDIVPDLLGVGGSRNWGPEQRAIFFNGCQPVEEATLDTDADGLPDAVDADDDGDGLADVADGDSDGDGVPNEQDPDAVPVPDQDQDGIPDALDADDDGDCILDSVDKDRDGDGIPNASDPDLDNDGTPNPVDVDMDGDGVANLLDTDADGNGIATERGEAAGARTRSAEGLKAVCSFETDPDGDGIPSSKDSDDDGDGLPDSVDEPASRPWVDTDGDGIPNVKDGDLDGDGIPNTRDSDLDGDGVPDARDVDDDGDGLVDDRSASSGGKPARPVRASVTVTFAPMSDVLSASARDELRGLAKKVGRTPSAVVSIGYVQKSGTSANDKQLSTARARAAAAYLGSLGVTSVFTVRGDGVGGSDPAARKVVVSATTR